MSSLALENRLGGFLDPSKVNWLRSMLLLGVGASVGLGIAAPGVIAARGKLELPPEDVALINGRPVLRSDYRTQIEATYGPIERTTPAQRKTVLDAMIREELLVQKGLQLDMPWTAPDVRGALLGAMEQKVISNVVTTPPEETALLAYYNSHRAAYFTYGRMTLHDLVAPASLGDAAAQLREGEAAAGELSAGQSVDAVAAHHHLAKNANAEGELFSITTKLRLGYELFAAADTLKDGQARAVVAGGTVHVLAMVRNQRPVLMSYDKVRTTVLGDYERDRELKVENAELKYLKSKAAIRLGPGYDGA